MSSLKEGREMDYNTKWRMLQQRMNTLRSQKEYYDADEIRDALGRALHAAKTDMAHAERILDLALNNVFIID